MSINKTAIPINGANESQETTTGFINEAFEIEDGDIEQSNAEKQTLQNSECTECEDISKKQGNTDADSKGKVSGYNHKSNEIMNSHDRNTKLLENDAKLVEAEHISSMIDSDVIIRRFSGLAYRSFKEKNIKKNWKRTSFEECFLEKELNWERESELTRSQYSLVSCGDLTAGALQLWLGLPEEVKYDPALAPFRQYYEKENAKLESLPLKSRKLSGPKNKRLPLVNSAPHLNNNDSHLRFQNGVNTNPQNGSQPTIHFAEAISDPFGEHLEDGRHEDTHSKRSTKMDQARYYTKITLLVAAWIFFTVVFLMYNEKEVTIRNSVIISGEEKDYILDVSKDKLTLQIDLSGPFLSEQSEKELNSTEKVQRSTVEVWLERWTLNRPGTHVTKEDVIKTEKSASYKIYLLPSEEIDFSLGEKRSPVLYLESNFTGQAVYVIKLKSDSSHSIPFSMSYNDNPLEVKVGLIYASILLVLLYGLIIFEVINRTLAAVLVSTMSLAALALAGERPSVPELISWLDVETLLLLFSMMLLVAIMAETGMFDFLAVYTFQVTKGKMWPLINVLCAITALLSTFLDNVTTVLLITPITIKLCEVMELHPIPILMSMVLYSNIGGTATPVGDPPNVIIASNQIVVQSGINFANFTLHMTVGILVVCLQTYFQLRFIYRDTNKLRLSENKEVQDLRRQISVWRRAADSLPHMSKDEIVVKERLERKVQKMNSQLTLLLKERRKRACPKDTFDRTLQELKDKYKIRDKSLLIKACVAIGFVVLMFFLHAFPEFSRISLGWTALLGALLLLILADREDLESILNRVEWSTLLFFAALFVLMEALTKLGLINFIGGQTEDLIMKVDEEQRLAVALLLILWISGITSAFVDNIPLTTMMVRVVTSLGTNPDLNLPLQPLIWALSYGACLGGNGTLIGASANVVCAGVADQHGYKITFTEFFKVGFPIMIGHLIVASAYLLICHCVFTWH